jgi:TRAP transporter TAXI family solute receptor
MKCYCGDIKPMQIKSFFAEIKRRIDVAVLVAAVVSCAPVWAQDRVPPGDVQFFRIGTGPTTGVYFPAGALIASVVSNPPGSRPCERGGSCGVPGLIAVAQATQDSVERLALLADHRIESALVQSEVASLAYAGKGPFNHGRLGNLRAIATLYPEYWHVVVRGDGSIRSFADLKGKRVGIDLDGSGTRILNQAALPQIGLKTNDIIGQAMSVSAAADQMRLRRLDAFTYVSGVPVESIQRLADDMPIALLPVTPAVAQRLIKANAGLSPAEIPAGVYRGVPATVTVATSALWLVSAEADPALVYGLTRALWHQNNRRLLDGGHPVGRSMRLETALSGLTIPLHPGAERYYREMGYPIPTAALAPTSALPSIVPHAAPGR